MPSPMRELGIFGAKIAMMALIRNWPSTDEDLTAWDRLAEEAQTARSNPMAAAVELSTQLTPGPLAARNRQRDIQPRADSGVVH